MEKYIRGWSHGAGSGLTQRARDLGRKFFPSLPPDPRNPAPPLLLLEGMSGALTASSSARTAHHQRAQTINYPPSWRHSAFNFPDYRRINSICETSLGHLREHHNSFCSPEIVTRTRFCNANCLIFINSTVLHNLPAL